MSAPAATTVTTSSFKSGWIPSEEALKVQLTQEQRALYKQTFEQIRQLIQQHLPNKPPCEKVGSFGKKTAIQGSDIDIVVRFPNLKSEDDFEVRAAELNVFVRQHSNVFKNAEFNGWVVSCHVNGIPVDIVPAPIVENVTAHILEHGALQFMRASVSASNRDYVRSRFGVYSAYPLQNVIRLVKHWSNLQTWNTKDQTPSSFLLELVCLEAVDRIKNDAKTSRQTGDELLRSTFEEALQLLAKSHRSIIWHSKIHPVPTQQAKQYISDPNVPQFHWVADPSNPHNNVANRLKDPSLLRQYAKQTLQDLGWTAVRANAL